MRPFLFLMLAVLAWMILKITLEDGKLTVLILTVWRPCPVFFDYIADYIFSLVCVLYVCMWLN